MKAIIVIPARYASSRFPGKPLARIKGKPLIEWVYKAASESSLAHRVIVATDDKRISECVRSFGGEVVLTSPHCPSGTDRVAEAVKKLNEDSELIVNVQGDEPLIKGEVIDAVIEELRKVNAIVTLKKRITDMSEYNNPNVVKVVCNSLGFALYFSRSPIPYMRNQGESFKHIGIYGYRRDLLFKFVSLSIGILEKTEGLEQLRAIENGIPIKVIETEYEAVGVDVPEDISKVEKLLGERDAN